jgi:hypothetical protein
MLAETMEALSPAAEQAAVDKTELLRRTRQLVQEAVDEPGDVEANSAAMVLLSATQVGTNICQIANFTGMTRSEIRKYVMNYRKYGIFRGKNVCSCWMLEGEKEGESQVEIMTFLCDVLVGLGEAKKDYPQEPCIEQPEATNENRPTET